MNSEVAIVNAEKTSELRKSLIGQLIIGSNWLINTLELLLVIGY